MVSIIIPVFNTPINVLKRCFDSVDAQNGIEYEVVIVDDGSIPEVASYCDDVAKSLSCLCKIRHQSNLGISASRNIGVGISTGEWIYFLDSDDALADSGSIARLLSVALSTKAEVVVGQSHLPGGFDCSPASGRDWLLRCLLNDDVSFTVWDTLYNRDRCRAEPFQPGLVHEDEDFSPRLLFGSELVVGAWGKPTYTRVQREGSITTSTTELATYRRCRGKMVVCLNMLENPNFKADRELWTLIQSRAFGFANAAFLEWSRSSFCPSHVEELTNLSEKIDWSLSRVGVLNYRNVRTWTCMLLVRLVGPMRYVQLLELLLVKHNAKYKNV